MRAGRFGEPTPPGSPMADGSITRWLRKVQQGDDTIAERELWDHYFSRLAALARRKLDDLPPNLRDDEEVALSALNSFFARAKQESLSQVGDRTELWRLLARITVRKAGRRRRSVYAKKRGGGPVPVDPEFADALSNLAATEPTPDMLLAMSEECERLLNALSPDLRTVARMKLEGYANREIATALGGVERTVERKLARIRHAWLKQVEQS